MHKNADSSFSAEPKRWINVTAPVCASVTYEFTTTHYLHGSMVRDIGGLLTALKKRFDRHAKSPSTRTSGAAAAFDRKAFDKQLQAAVSQWHSERDQKLNEKHRADAAEARSVMLLEEITLKDSIIADLKRQLAARDGLRVVD